jgi:NADH-quinone oxidoreductase subunit C
VKTVEEIKAAIVASVPGAGVEIIPNPSPSAQHSLLLKPEHAVAVAYFLRDDAELALDFLSNVTGVDWLAKEVVEKVKVTKPVTNTEPGYLEAVYHLYSMRKKHGPVVIRMRTANRADKVELPSLTPVWRSAEFQEREVFDLYGIVFKGHPDLRRLLMWPEFTDYPMRKDYVEPDDFEYEPTAHDKVLERAKTHQQQGSESRDQGSEKTHAGEAR